MDTGSAITIISFEVLEKLGRSSDDLDPLPYDLCLADGQQLKVGGRMDLEITLGPIKSVHTIVVGDINSSAILGMDFMANHACQLDLNKSVMKINNMEVNMWQDGKGKSKCCKVTLCENVTIPARSEHMVNVFICKRGSESHLNIIEGSRAFQEKYGLLVARSLNDTSKSTTIVRLCNPNETDISLRQNTVVGLCEPIVWCEAHETESLRVLNINVGSENHSSEESSKVPAHLEQLYQDGKTHLHIDECEELLGLLIKYQDVFAKSDTDLGRTSEIKHKIDTGSAKPIRQKPRRIPIHMQDEVNKIMEGMLEQGIIEPSSSPWQSPVVLVRKADNTLRFCVDYRKVNEVTTKDSYNIPNITESLDYLSGAKYYCSLDLASGYWQVEMSSDDKEKTAFATPYHGLYQFNVMPFGLCNAPGTFERLMENVLAGLQFKTLLIYLDDIIIPCKTFKEGLEHLATVFSRFKTAGLKLKPRKCHLFQKEVKYLGHKVSENGIQTDPEKIEAVKAWPTPTNVHEVRSFIGLCSYYRKFIKSFSEVAEPLHRLTRKNQTFTWSRECEAAFTLLKEKLTTSPILAYPSVDKSFILDTDASDTAMGAVLSQRFEEGDV